MRTMGMVFHGLLTTRKLLPWYGYVEKFIGVNGRNEGLPQLPDGELQKPMPWHALEKTIESRLKKKAPDVTLTNARTAILTEDLPGRSACHYCGPCPRGCSTGSYFSSLSSTLPAAKATGNLTIRANSLVEKLEYDPETGKIAKVHVIDTVSGERQTYSARIFFLCASTVGSTQILMNSTSERFPNGLANSSGVLGHYMMDHTIGEKRDGFVPRQHGQLLPWKSTYRFIHSSLSQRGWSGPRRRFCTRLWLSNLYIAHGLEYRL